MTAAVSFQFFWHERENFPEEFCQFRRVIIIQLDILFNLIISLELEITIWIRNISSFVEMLLQSLVESFGHNFWLQELKVLKVSFHQQNMNYHVDQLKTFEQCYIMHVYNMVLSSILTEVIHSSAQLARSLSRTFLWPWKITDTLKQRELSDWNIMSSIKFSFHPSLLMKMLIRWR